MIHTLHKNNLKTVASFQIALFIHFMKYTEITVNSQLRHSKGYLGNTKIHKISAQWTFTMSGFYACTYVLGQRLQKLNWKYQCWTSKVRKLFKDCKQIAGCSEFRTETRLRSQSQYEIQNTLPIFSGLDKDSHFTVS